MTRTVLTVALVCGSPLSASSVVRGILRSRPIASASRAVLCAGSHPPELPRSVAEISKQAAFSTLAALDAGHSRLQLTLRSAEEPLIFGSDVQTLSPLCEVLNSISHALAARGVTVRLFFASMELAEHALGVINLEPPGPSSPAPSPADRPRGRPPTGRRAASAPGALHVDVLGMGQLLRSDGCALIVTPASAGVAYDAHVLGAVQQLLLQANKRAVILVNPELQAVSAVRPRARGAKVRPTFMRDFEHCYHLETSRPTTSYALAVHRIYPDEWVVYWRGRAGAAETGASRAGVESAAGSTDGDGGARNGATKQSDWFRPVLTMRSRPRRTDLDALLSSSVEELTVALKLPDRR